ncbi:MAG: ATP-binding cassette domain-containing protein [Oscillospiraceae bacterium]|nr:ATP-binding cassette domain-containing protein [Oscillospiraceae bacterium]
MPTIELEHVTKLYKLDRRKHGGKRFEVGVKDVDLTIQQGEFVFVIGSSGAGKSTLLNLIAGTMKPNSGRVSVDGKDLSWMMRWSRNRVSLLFGKVLQEPSLIRKRTVEENLALAARIAASRMELDKSFQARVKKVLGLVGLRGVAKKYPIELSLGEFRRVELARALISSPPILVLDEITANLDDDSIWDIMHLLNEINHRGTTVIMATHASQYVNIMRRRVVTLVDGKLVGDVRNGKYGDIV